MLQGDQAGDAEHQTETMGSAFPAGESGSQKPPSCPVCFDGNKRLAFHQLQLSLLFSTSTSLAAQMVVPMLGATLSWGGGGGCHVIVSCQQMVLRRGLLLKEPAIHWDLCTHGGWHKKAPAGLPLIRMQPVSPAGSQVLWWDWHKCATKGGEQVSRL